MRSRADSAVISAFFAIVIGVSGIASAQEPARTFEELRQRVQPGATVWVTNQAGNEVKGQLLDLTPNSLILTSKEGRLELMAAEAVRVRQKRSDRLWNGALIGAASTLVPSILYCRVGYEFGESCDENVMDMVIVGAAGAAVGVLIDVAIKGRQTIYQRPAGTMTVRLVPLASRRSIGLFLDVRPPWSRE